MHRQQDAGHGKLFLVTARVFRYISRDRRGWDIVDSDGRTPTENKDMVVDSLHGIAWTACPDS
jgi:hypothetical protein